MEIVRSEIFSNFPEILFGMSTTQGGVSPNKFGLNLSYTVGDLSENVSENRRRFFSSLGITEDRIAFTQQMHTNNIAAVSSGGKFPNTDALVTNQRNVYLSISSADCTPVMLYDPVTKTIAGIHAGWRGTASKITKKTVAKMFVYCGAKPANIVAFIGPSAGSCCYEVDEEVAKRFPAQCSVLNADSKYFLDVKKANLIQLLECGVQGKHIEIHNDCSIHDIRYHSHRRDGKESGRMLAIIGMKG